MLSQQYKPLSHNIWKFYVYKGAWGLSLGLMVSILVLYYLDLNISLAGFMTLMAIIALTKLVMEVPGGIIADKFSRKWSVCIGASFKMLSILMMVTTASYPMHVIAFVCWGLGESLISGADTALLYDSLQADQQSQRFPQVIGNAISLAMITTVLGTLLCGLIVTQFGLVGPFWAAIGATLIVILISANFTEPPFLQQGRSSAGITTLRTQAVDYLHHIQLSVRLILGSRELLALIFVNIVFLRAIFLTERPFSQPYLTEFGYSAQQISFLFTGFYLITALFAKYSPHLVKLVGKNERSTIMLIGGLGITALIVLASAWNSAVVVVALIGFYIMRGLFEPFMEASLNRRFDSEKRASCLSIAKMGGSLLAIILGPIFGYLADRFSLQTSLLIFQWIFVPLFLVGIFWNWRILGLPTPLRQKAV